MNKYIDKDGDGVARLDISYRALFSLHAKVAIVTGGAGTLGKQFCRCLAEAGAKVAVVDLRVDEAIEIAKSLAEVYKVEAIGVGCDVSNQHSVNAMLSEVVGVLGGVNILLNNAAGKSDNLEAFFSPFEDYSIEQWREIMSVNLDGMFLVAQAIGRHMVTQKSGGSIVQVSSIYGVMAPDHRIYEDSYYLGHQINTPAVYAASKAGVIGLSKYLASYWAEHNIRVNTLTPGGVESGQNDIFKRRYASRVPMARMGMPFEMVGAMLYLASDASSYVTGQNIIVDGGLHCW